MYVAAGAGAGGQGIGGDVELVTRRASEAGDAGFCIKADHPAGIGKHTAGGAADGPLGDQVYIGSISRGDGRPTGDSDTAGILGAAGGVNSGAIAGNGG